MVHRLAALLLFSTLAVVSCRDLDAEDVLRIYVDQEILDTYLMNFQGSNPSQRFQGIRYLKRGLRAIQKNDTLLNEFIGAFAGMMKDTEVYYEQDIDLYEYLRNMEKRVPSMIVRRVYYWIIVQVLDISLSLHSNRVVLNTTVKELTDMMNQRLPVRKNYVTENVLRVCRASIRGSRLWSQEEKDCVKEYWLTAFGLIEREFVLYNKLLAREITLKEFWHYDLPSEPTEKEKELITWRRTINADRYVARLKEYLSVAYQLDLMHVFIPRFFTQQVKAEIEIYQNLLIL